MQWAQGSGTPGRFEMQIGHLCSTAQDNSHSTPGPGQGSTRMCLPDTKVRGLLYPQSRWMSKSSSAMKVSNDPHRQTERFCWATNAVHDLRRRQNDIPCSAFAEKPHI